jgi:hypothetical protein
MSDYPDQQTSYYQLCLQEVITFNKFSFVSQVSLLIEFGSISLSSFVFKLHLEHTLMNHPLRTVSREGVSCILENLNFYWRKCIPTCSFLFSILANSLLAESRVQG